MKLDPLAFETELRPDTAGVVTAPRVHVWSDGAWLRERRQRDPLRSPMSVYEVHLGSWMRVPEEENR